MLIYMIQLFNQHGEAAGVGNNSLHIRKDNILAHFMSNTTNPPDEKLITKICTKFFELYAQGIINKEVKNNDYLVKGFHTCVLEAMLPTKLPTKKHKI